MISTKHIFDEKRMDISSNCLIEVLMTWSFAKQHMMKCFCSFTSGNYFLSDHVFVTALVFRICAAVIEVPLKARPMQHSKQLLRVVLVEGCIQNDEA